MSHSDYYYETNKYNCKIVRWPILGYFLQIQMTCLSSVDFGRDVKGDKEKNWLILQQTDNEALQAYQLCVSNILSRT